MQGIEKTLTLDEHAAAEKVFAKLSVVDTANVRTVIGTVDQLTEMTLGHLQEQAEQRTRMYGALDPEGDSVSKAHPFFAVYAVGGLVTKAETNDTDLLFATNGWWQTLPKGRDWFLHLLRAEKKEDWTLEEPGELPDGYNLGITKGKALITIRPQQGKKVDIIYVRSIESKSAACFFPWDEGYKPQTEKQRTRYMFDSEQEFIAKDVGREGNQLPRVLLYRAIIQLPRDPDCLRVVDIVE